MKNLLTSSLLLWFLIRSAVNLINQRITGVMDDYDTVCPATRIMPHRDWVLFLQKESQRTNTADQEQELFGTVW
ncbi:hypothetical protein BC941DRAFT_441191 [Chlamydoabsidia padenii]|nr:hypothetical protein BC941DRAFT_441191 [Chlamydoabsidia padenii]